MALSIAEQEQLSGIARDFFPSFCLHHSAIRFSKVWISTSRLSRLVDWPSPLPFRRWQNDEGRMMDRPYRRIKHDWHEPFISPPTRPNYP